MSLSLSALALSTASAKVAPKLRFLTCEGFTSSCVEAWKVRFIKIRDFKNHIKGNSVFLLKCILFKIHVFSNLRGTVFSRIAFIKSKFSESSYESHSRKVF